MVGRARQVCPMRWDVGKGPYYLVGIHCHDHDRVEDSCQSLHANECAWHVRSISGKSRNVQRIVL